MTVRTRFAPSPTGTLHVGGARTALFSWLQARHHGGEFVLRIEDTDRERSTEESVQTILDGMAWLGLNYDQELVFQSQRFDRYREVIQRLLDEEKAYHCYCSRERLDALRKEQMAQKIKPRYDGHCLNRKGAPPDVSPVVRFRNPTTGAVVVDDLIQGKVTYQNAELDDLIIARSDGTPTYNLTVVVDDWDMEITQVIRGDDHVNNTPRQMNILRALGAEPPVYAHVPMILGEDGQRLSKRHGAVSVLQYRNEGFLPEALLNYLVRLGWSHGDQEIFSIDEMTGLFDVRDVNKAASVFDTGKLLWLNSHYIKQADSKRLGESLKTHLDRLDLNTANGPTPETVAEVQRERGKTLKEMAEISTFLYADFDDFDEKAATKHLRPVIQEAMSALRERLSGVEDWTAETLHGVVEDTATELGLKLGKIAQPVRVAVTGRAASPPIDITLELVGKARTLARIDRALVYIQQRADALTGVGG